MSLNEVQNTKSNFSGEFALSNPHGNPSLMGYSETSRVGQSLDANTLEDYSFYDYFDRGLDSFDNYVDHSFGVNNNRDGYDRPLDEITNNEFTASSTFNMNNNTLLLIGGALVVMYLMK